MRSPRSRSLCFLILLSLAANLPRANAQDDGGTAPTDGGGGGVLQSIYVPNLPDAPFSLTLHTEWIHTMRNGGNVTVTNTRPIVRDSAGRLYEERWMLTPKGGTVSPQMTWIQVDDPVAGKFYQCSVFQKVCELLPSVVGLRHYQPEKHPSGPLKDGKGTFLHEDLGADSVAGLPVHAYRDTTTINAGTYGNDAPMVTVREFRYSPELGFNLSSVLDSAQSGRQLFTVTDLTTAEPDPKYFGPPVGYRVVDKRKPASPASNPTQ